MPSARPGVEHGLRRLIPAALFALAPKCLACVLAYAGLGAALGLSGPELCGAPAASRDPAATALTMLGLAAAGLFLIRRRASSSPASRPRG